MNHFTTSLSNWCTAAAHAARGRRRTPSRARRRPTRHDVEAQLDVELRPARIAASPSRPPRRPRCATRSGRSYPLGREVRGEALRVEHLEQAGQREVARRGVDDRRSVSASPPRDGGSAILKSDRFPPGTMICVTVPARRLAAPSAGASFCACARRERDHERAAAHVAERRDPRSCEAHLHRDASPCMSPVSVRFTAVCLEVVGDLGGRLRQRRAVVEELLEHATRAESSKRSLPLFFIGSPASAR